MSVTRGPSADGGRVRSGLRSMQERSHLLELHQTHTETQRFYCDLWLLLKVSRDKLGSGTV